MKIPGTLQSAICAHLADIADLLALQTNSVKYCCVTECYHAKMALPVSTLMCPGCNGDLHMRTRKDIQK